MKPEMYLITKDFPYGHGEDTFAGAEYPYLCKAFQVSVIATEVEPDTEHGRTESINAHIVSVSQGIFDKIVSLLRFMLEKDCYTEIAAIIKEGKQTGRRIYRALMFGTAAETFYRRLKKATGIRRDTKAVFYFYWFDYKCFGFAMHKHKFPGIKMIARTHGCDLYDERERYGKQFFQPQMDDRLTKLIFAAQFAKNYYIRRYHKRETDRYSLHRLGVSEKGITYEQRKVRKKEGLAFLMVSCSHALSIKRINLIIGGLSTVEDEDIKWIHIGDGEELQALQAEAQKKLGEMKNIQYQFVGALTNDKVLQFYRDNYVGCFITTTQTEGGSPVSVQEALSFGVPVIATAVGELPQMVRGNGALLSENPNKEEIGQAIRQIAGNYGSEEYFSMCRNSLIMFKEKFDAERNFTALTKELQDITI